MKLEQRFTAALAVMQSILADSPRPDQAKDIVPMSVKLADMLIAELERTAPKCEAEPTKETCEHEMENMKVHDSSTLGWHWRTRCKKCGLEF